MRIAVLVDHPQAASNIRLAFKHRPGPAPVSLQTADSWSELRQWYRSGQADLALVQPSFGIPGPAREAQILEMERLVYSGQRERTLVMVCRPSSVLLEALSQMGLVFVLRLGVDDDPGRILRAVGRAQVRLRLVGILMERGLPPVSDGFELLLEIVAGWPPAPSVLEQARRMGKTPRDLNRTLGRKGLPSVGRLLSWGLLLEGCSLAAMGLGKAQWIATLLEMGGSDSLGHRSRRLTGRPFSQFRDFPSGSDPFATFAEAIGF